jgi:FtsH-binding integral membrane protein
MIKDFLNIKSASGFLQTLVVFLIVLLINMLIVRFLWNTALVKHISVLKPVDTLFDTLLLSVALTMFQGSCMSA